MDFVIRMILCFLFPPLAVFDKGYGPIILVLLLTLLGWIPGTIAALIICLADREKNGGQQSNDPGNIEETSKEAFSIVIRYLLCLIFPPLAVFDKGCGTMLLVLLFTFFGWLPGTILAFLICIRDRNYRKEE